MVHGSWTDGALWSTVERSGASGVVARRWGGRGRAGQGEAGGRLTAVGPAARRGPRSRRRRLHGDSGASAWVERKMRGACGE
jgi:hypothetical protein